MDCDDNALSQQRGDNEKPCKLDTKIYGECGEFPYGYSKDNLAPCVFIKLNKILQFNPEPLSSHDITNETGIPPMVNNSEPKL